jgi:hypothetical protein
VQRCRCPAKRVVRNLLIRLTKQRPGWGPVGAGQINSVIFYLCPLARVVLLNPSVSKHRIVICRTMAGVCVVVDRPGMGPWVTLGQALVSWLVVGGVWWPWGLGALWGLPTTRRVPPKVVA